MTSTNLSVDGIRRVAQDAYFGERSIAQKKMEGPEIMGLLRQNKFLCRNTKVVLRRDSIDVRSLIKVA